MEPVRWRDAPGALEPELAAALEQARSAPNEAQLAMLAARMTAALDGALPAQEAARDEVAPVEQESARRRGVGMPSTDAGDRLRRLLLIGVAALGLVGGGMLLGRELAPPSADVPRPQENVRVPAAASRPATPFAPALSDAPAEPAPQGVPMAGGQENLPSPASAAVVRTRRPRVDRPAPQIQPLAESKPAASPRHELEEIELLQRARRVLVSDPARAITLLAQHRARFARGVFSEEREALEIEALARAGKRHSAEEKHVLFRETYPKSAYLPRIERLLSE